MSGTWSFIRAGGSSKWESSIKEAAGVWTLLVDGFVFEERALGTGLERGTQ